MKRCTWAEGNEIYEKYHDEEWGVPVGLGSRTVKSSPHPPSSPRKRFSSLDVPTGTSRSEKTLSEPLDDASGQELSAHETSIDDKKHFEFLVLEGAQAGLSWLTILKRRDGYRRIYKGFDPKTVAKFNQRYVESMLKDSGIIRNRQKVLSSINNAKVFLEIQKEFGSFDNYIWGFTGGKPVVKRPKTDKGYNATDELSDKVSIDLKNRGMSFVGSTIIYAHLQATGVIDEHMADCFRSQESGARS